MKQPRSTSAALVSAAIGAALGVGSAYFSRARKPGYGMLLGGVLGGSLAYGAWKSAPNALHRVNALRDARWLAKNPICYA